jgi:uncharacterized YigZ family protein
MQKYYYNTILKENHHEIQKIKWSKFIGHVFHITSKQEAEKYIEQINNNQSDATHNCFAYTYGTNLNFNLFGNIEITPENFKQNDNWEPINTAWKPILAQIQWHKLHNVLIIVTRYFWWTLLGIWWLIQAYWKCAKQIILHSKIEEIEIIQNMKISFEYQNISTIMNLLNKYEAKIINENHWEKADILFDINKGYLDYFKKSLSKIWNITINLD